MNSDEFRDYIGQKVHLAREVLQDHTLELLARERGCKMDELVFSHLNKVFRQEYLARFSRDSSE